MKGPVDQGGFVYPIYADDPSGKLVDRGITLRDWFAGMAMSGLVAASQTDRNSMRPTTALEVAQAAYHVADLMIRISRADAQIPEQIKEPTAAG